MTDLGGTVKFVTAASVHLQSKLSVEWSQVGRMKHHLTAQLRVRLNGTFNKHQQITINGK